MTAAAVGAGVAPEPTFLPPGPTVVQAPPEAVVEEAALVVTGIVEVEEATRKPEEPEAARSAYFLTLVVATVAPRLRAASSSSFWI